MYGEDNSTSHPLISIQFLQFIQFTVCWLGTGFSSQEYCRVMQKHCSAWFVTSLSYLWQFYSQPFSGTKSTGSTWSKENSWTLSRPIPSRRLSHYPSFDVKIYTHLMGVFYIPVRLPAVSSIQSISCLPAVLDRYVVTSFPALSYRCRYQTCLLLSSPHRVTWNAGIHAPDLGWEYLTAPSPATKPMICRSPISLAW